jgi:hypothetical protein
VEIELNISGDVLDRSELLNGTQTVTLDGATDDGAWRLAGEVSWSRGLIEYPGEGDITLEGADGAALFGTLTAALPRDVESDVDAAEVLALRYEIDGGAGAFAAAAGSATAALYLAGDRFRGRWQISLPAQAP